MRKFFLHYLLTIIFLVNLPLFAQIVDSTSGYIIRHEFQLLKRSKSPHNGKGETLGCAFFDDLKDFNISFRKRILQNGASLGKHLQTEDEIYFVISGEGKIIINDVPIPVKPGDAILTRKGSTHELLQISKNDLVIFVVFNKHD